MVWVGYLFLLLILLFIWLMITDLTIHIDTRIPEAYISLYLIGSFKIWYEDEWLARIRIAFFEKTLHLNRQKKAEPKPKTTKKCRRSKMSFARIMAIIKRVVPSFCVKQCCIHLDTGDYTWNARLYALKGIPVLSQYLDINFRNDNYGIVTLKNRLIYLVVACIGGYFSTS